MRTTLLKNRATPAQFHCRADDRRRFVISSCIGQFGRYVVDFPQLSASYRGTPDAENKCLHTFRHAVCDLRTVQVAIASRLRRALRAERPNFRSRWTDLHTFRRVLLSRTARSDGLSTQAEETLNQPAAIFDARRADLLSAWTFDAHCPA